MEDAAKKRLLDEALKKIGITCKGTETILINCNPDTGTVCDWKKTTRHK